MATYSNISLVVEPQTFLFSASGVEITGSRRFVDLYGSQRARVQFSSSSNMSIAIEYQLEGQSTWNTLIPEDSYYGSNPYTSGWFALDEACKENNVLLRVLGYGSGLTVTINHVSLDWD